MEGQLIQPEPIAIESLNKESLKGKSVEELEVLHQYMRNILHILKEKMQMVHDIKEEVEQLESDKAELSKLPEGKRKRFTQILGGDHIAKDEKTAPGATTK